MVVSLLLLLIWSPLEVRKGVWWQVVWLTWLVFFVGLVVGGEVGLISPVFISEWVFLDLVSWVFVQLSVLIGPLCVVGSSEISFGYKNSPFFLFCVGFSVFSLVMAFVSTTLLWFYWWFESSIVPLLLIIVGWGYEVDRFLASKYMAAYTMAGSLPFLALIGWELNKSGSVVMVGGFISAIPVGWWVLGYLPFLVKAPMYGLHSWLPKAHVEAPVAGSILLAALTLKLGGYGLVRISGVFSLGMSSLELVLVVMSLWGSLVSSLVCLRQTDYKSLIAYSSISHMGLVLAGIMSGSCWGWTGALVLMVGHAFSSSGLFFLAGVVYRGIGTRSFLMCHGVLGISPFIMFPGFLLLAGNMAAPFTLNLCGEVILAVGLVSAFKPLWPILVLVSFMTGAYSLHFFSSLFHGVLGTCVATWAGPSLSELFVLWAHVIMMVLCVFLLDFLAVWA